MSNSCDGDGACSSGLFEFTTAEPLVLGWQEFVVQADFPEGFGWTVDDDVGVVVADEVDYLWRVYCGHVVFNTMGYVGKVHELSDDLRVFAARESTCETVGLISKCSFLGFLDDAD